MDLATISEIDNVRLNTSPHEKELKDLCRKWVRKFRTLDGIDPTKLARLVGAREDELGLDEEWTLTKEFFPKVGTHLSYYYYGEEFSNHGGEDAFRFLFSGDRVREVTGEDLLGLIERMLNFIGSSLTGEADWKAEESLSLEDRGKYFKRREETLKYLRLDDEKELEEVADYLGGHYEKTGPKCTITKEFFPAVEVVVELDGGLDVDFSGSKLKMLRNYDLSLLAVFALNHMIRYITKKHQNEDLPGICHKMFP